MPKHDFRRLEHISGQLIDIPGRRIYPAQIHMVEGRIASIEEVAEAPDVYLMPGFVDAHIHIESSMLTPYEFARIALRHGTVATVSDPHEIANVLGLPGVDYMIENARQAPLKFFFGAPSCVPATSFETAGATIDSADIGSLLASPDIWYLAEMMNYPGVLGADPEVMAKIEAAHRIGKPVDGHAPGLKGELAEQYISAGITTDHECFTLEEALDKLKFGMKVQIREGSAAKNFEALHPLINSHADRLMFCSDDKHPDDLLVSHIDELVRRGLALGYDLFDLLQMACLNPVEHYGLPVGQLRVGDPADFIVVSSPEHLLVQQTIIEGQVVAEAGAACFASMPHACPNHFQVSPKEVGDFAMQGSGKSIPVMVALDGQLITERKEYDLPTEAGEVQADPERDILKIAVVNRYRNAPVAVGFIQGFGLRRGALASTVAHDSHNIVAVGVDDESLCRAVNLLISEKGGLSAVDGEQEKVLPLPIAGIMSPESGESVGAAYQEIDAMVRTIGCGLKAPYMTLSFMALLVIPKLKMSDLGLFDAEVFRMIYPVTSV